MSNSIHRAMIVGHDVFAYAVRAGDIHDALFTRRAVVGVRITNDVIILLPNRLCCRTQYLIPLMLPFSPPFTVHMSSGDIFQPPSRRLVGPRIRD